MNPVVDMVAHWGRGGKGHPSFCEFSKSREKSRSEQNLKEIILRSTQPETRKLQQVSSHQADNRMRSHRLLRLDDNKSVTNC